jgi:hypothetical protein
MVRRLSCQCAPGNARGSGGEHEGSVTRARRNRDHARRRLQLAACSSAVTVGGRDVCEAIGRWREPSASGASGAIDIAQFDACALMTPDEIGGIIGDAVKAGEKRGSDRTAGCQGDAKDTSLLKFVQVYVSAFNQENWDIGLLRADKEIAGIGEAAYRSESDIAPPGHLTIKHSGLLIDLVFFEDPPDEKKVLDQQEELAKLVVSRIK